jgi:hypothetical protein
METTSKKGKRIIGYGTWSYDDMPTPLAAGGNMFCYGARPSAHVPDLPYTECDGSSIKIDTDYFGNKRDPEKPTP